MTANRLRFEIDHPFHPDRARISPEQENAVSTGLLKYFNRGLMADNLSQCEYEYSMRSVKCLSDCYQSGVLPFRSLGLHGSNLHPIPLSNPDLRTLQLNATNGTLSYVFVPSGISEDGAQQILSELNQMK